MTSPCPTDSGPDPEGPNDRAAIPLPAGDSVLFRLMVLVNHVSRPFVTEISGQVGLSLTDWRVLLVVGHQPDLSGNDIADHLGLDRMGVSRSLRRLVAAGRVERRSDPRFPNRYTHRVTAAGRALLADLGPKAGAREADMLATLDRADVEQLKATLDTLIDRVRSLDSAAGGTLPNPSPAAASAS